MRSRFCDECRGTVGGEWRRICCACGKALHDKCWQNDRLERAYRSECDWGTCECGGGFNLWSWDTKVTSCEDSPNCRCEEGDS